MSRRLANLLDESELAVNNAIKKLESLSGFDSVDVKMLAEINGKARAKMEQLGLDPHDTEGTELYHALLTKYENDEKQLRSSLGISSNKLNAEEFINQIVKFLEFSGNQQNVWALKRSVAKNLFKKHPPKVLMKKLNYRSVDSLLKRENIDVVFEAALFSESGRWQNGFWKSFSNLSGTDFENRPIEIVITHGSKWQKIGEEYAAITNVAALGAIVTWHNEALKNLGAISLCLLMTHHLKALRVSSGYIKIHQVETDFSKALLAACRDGISHPLELSRMPLHWGTIFQHYGKTSLENFQEAFEPHILQEDINLADDLKQLAKANPIFRWWVDHEHVAAVSSSGQKVSFNIMDVMVSYTGNNSFETRNTHYFKQSLWHNLIDKYLEYLGVKNFVMSRIGMLEPAYENEMPQEPANINEHYIAGAI
jgi:hypothetical protein